MYQVGHHKILVEVGDKFAKIDAEITLQVYDEGDADYYLLPTAKTPPNSVTAAPVNQTLPTGKVCLAYLRSFMLKKAQ